MNYFYGSMNIYGVGKLPYAASYYGLLWSYFMNSEYLLKWHWDREPLRKFDD